MNSLAPPRTPEYEHVSHEVKVDGQRLPARRSLPRRIAWMVMRATFWHCPYGRAVVAAPAWHHPSTPPAAAATTPFGRQPLAKLGRVEVQGLHLPLNLRIRISPYRLYSLLHGKVSLVPEIIYLIIEALLEVWHFMSAAHYYSM